MLLTAESYRRYLRQPAWARTRRRAIEARGSSCEACGFAGPIHVHHRTYERFGREAMDDLRILCDPCHTAVHKLERKTALSLADATDFVIRHGGVVRPQLVVRTSVVSFIEVDDFPPSFADEGRKRYEELSRQRAVRLIRARRVGVWRRVSTEPGRRVAAAPEPRAPKANRHSLDLQKFADEVNRRRL